MAVGTEVLGERGPEDGMMRALLSRIVQCDETAMTQFYRALSRTVYAFALRRLGQPGESEEVVTETMYEVWKNAHRFAGKSQVRTWVLGIARHKLLDKLRGRDSGHEELDEELVDSDATDRDYDELARRQRADQLAICLKTLPAAQRDALHLVFFEELPLAEVALIMDCPENTVKTRVFHAKRRLRQCLQHLLSEDT